MTGPEFVPAYLVLLFASLAVSLFLFIRYRDRAGTRSIVVDELAIHARSLTGRPVSILLGEISEATLAYFNTSAGKQRFVRIRSRDGQQEIQFTVHNPHFGELLKQLRAAGVAIEDRTRTDRPKPR